MSCLSGRVYDERAGWITCEECSGTGRARVFVYPKKRGLLAGCVGCGGRFEGRELIEVTEDHESLTFFPGDLLCEGCAGGHGIL